MAMPNWRIVAIAVGASLVALISFGCFDPMAEYISERRVATWSNGNAFSESTVADGNDASSVADPPMGLVIVVVPATSSPSDKTHLTDWLETAKTCQVGDNAVGGTSIGASSVISDQKTAVSTDLSTITIHMIPQTSKFVPETRYHDRHVPELEAIFASATENNTILASSLHRFHVKHFSNPPDVLPWQFESDEPGFPPGTPSPEQVTSKDATFPPDIPSTMAIIEVQIGFASILASGFSTREQTCRNHAGRFEDLCENVRAGESGPDIDIHRLADDYVQCRLENFAFSTIFDEAVRGLDDFHETLQSMVTTAHSKYITMIEKTGLVVANDLPRLQAFADELATVLKIGRLVDKRFQQLEPALMEMRASLIRLQGSRLRDEALLVLCPAE